MNPMKQLLRRPIHTLFAILLLSAACAFLCISSGIFLSVQESAKMIEDTYVTLAVPNPDAFEFSSSKTTDAWDALLSAAENEAAVKAVYQHAFISAMSPELSPLLSVQEEMHYDPSLDKPSDYAAFVVRVSDAAQTPSGGWDVSADIEQIVLLHPGYTVRSRLRFSYWNASGGADMDPPETGKTYLVYGRFVDDDLLLRQRLAEQVRCPLEEVDLSKISTEGAAALKKELLSRGFAEGLGDIAAEYVQEKTGRTTTLNPDELEMVDTASLFPQVLIDSETDRPFITVTCIDQPLDTFLCREENALWAGILRNAVSSQHGFPVIGTDRADTLYAFCQQTAYLSQGRVFSAAEYLSGEKVCILSERLAIQNGLHIGDSISLQFYGTGDPFQLEMSRQSNPFAQDYYPELADEADRGQFEIVGFYRQTDSWEYSLGQWTPNTILVPKAACPTRASSPHRMLFLSVVLKNGMSQRFLDSIRQKGLPENAFQILDSGYERIADSLENSVKGAGRYFFVSIVFWLAALIIYLFFFVSKQKDDVARMRSLGASSGEVRRYLFFFASVPAFLAVLIGMGLALTGMETAVQYICSAGSRLDTALSELYHSSSATAMIDVSVRKSLICLISGLQAGAHLAFFLLFSTCMVKAKRIYVVNLS